MIPHPTFGQPPVEIKLDELIQLQTGTVLLLGSLRLTTSDGVHEIVYNTGGSRPLEEFLTDLKCIWCSPLPTVQSVPSEAFRKASRSESSISADPSVSRRYSSHSRTSMAAFWLAISRR